MHLGGRTTRAEGSREVDGMVLGTEKRVNSASTRSRRRVHKCADLNSSSPFSLIQH